MRAGTFTLMPIEALTDHRLTLIQLRVLGALFSWRDKLTNVCSMTREQIAERCGYTPQSISKATAGLEALGWLEKVGKGGRGMAVRYAVTIPETVSDPGTVPDSETVPDPDTKTVSDPDTVKAENGVRSGHTQRNISIHTIHKEKKESARKRTIPPDFGLSDRVRQWCQQRGYGKLTTHLEHFVLYAQSSGKTYSDWDAALMRAIKDNWAKVPESEYRIRPKQELIV